MARANNRAWQIQRGFDLALFWMQIWCEKHPDSKICQKQWLRREINEKR